MDDEQLVEALKKSREWAAAERCLRELKISEVRIPVLLSRDTMASEAVESYSTIYEAPLAALRALRDEIRSGAIFGTPDKCCICGTKHGAGRTVARYHGDHTTFYACINGENRGCDAAWKQAEGDDNLPPAELAAAILRARKILPKQTPPPPPSPSSPKCDDCGKEIHGTPRDWVMPSHAGDTRKMCPSCHEHALHWCSRQTLLATLKANPLLSQPADFAAEKRHRVLMGLERGSDPRMLGTCDLTFDPRKR